MTKMKTIALVVAGAAGMLLSGSAQAQDVRITGIAANGSGCNANTVSALLAGSQASILFNSYTVSPTQQNPFQTRSCSVAVALSVNAGISVSAVNFQYLGTMALGPNSFGAFTRTLFFAGQQISSNLTQQFPAGQFTQINLNDKGGGAVFSTCNNAETIVRANTSLTINGPGLGGVDSVDAAAFQTMILDLRAFAANCNGAVLGRDTLGGPVPQPAPPRRGRRGRR